MTNRKSRKNSGIEAPRRRLVDVPNGVMQMTIIRRAEVGALFAAAAAGVATDPELSIACQVGNWIEKMLRRHKADCCLCLSCDTGFYGQEKPDAFLIVGPFAAMSPVLVSAICRHCADRDDDALRSLAFKTLRRDIYPALTLERIGRA